MKIPKYIKTKMHRIAELYGNKPIESKYILKHE